MKVGGFGYCFYFGLGHGRIRAKCSNTSVRRAVRSKKGV